MSATTTPLVDSGTPKFLGSGRVTLGMGVTNMEALPVGVEK